MLANGVCALSIAACGEPSLTDSAEGTDGPSVVIDPEVGRVGSVRLGDTPAQVAAAFGPGRRSERTVPIGADAEAIGAPANYEFAEPCDDYPAAGDRRPFSYRWATASYCRDRAFILMVTSRGTTTTTGIEIGDPLNSVQPAHPTMRCRSSTGSTTDPPVAVYRYCTGRLAPNRYLYVGQDPISSIAVSTVPLD